MKDMLKFVKPDEKYRREYTAMMDEWTAHGGRIAPWPLELAYKSDEDFKKMLEHIRGASIETGGVYAPSATYWVLDFQTGRMVGAANIRHYLKGGEQDIWGHIGYGVRPGERKKGYASEILKMCLDESKRLDIEKVLIVCFESNAGSVKVIEKNGGVFDNRVWADDGNEYIRRYWIQII